MRKRKSPQQKAKGRGIAQAVAPNSQATVNEGIAPDQHERIVLSLIDRLKNDHEPRAQAAFYLPAFNPNTIVERKEHLAKLQEWSDETGMFLLSGGPGAGKSTMARMFAWRMQQQKKFEVIVFQTCGRRSVEAIAGDLADTLREHLGDSVVQLPAPDKLQTVKRWLQRSRSLLILDDIWPEREIAAGQSLTLQDLLPAPPVSVLFTSRQPALAWVNARRRATLDAFSPPEVEETFRLYLGDTVVERHRDQLLAFAETVERLPIAVTVAAHLLQGESGPVAEAARGLRLEQLRSEVGDVPGLLRHAVEAQGEEERNLLRAASVCSPESFWLPLAFTIAGFDRQKGGQARNRVVNAGLLRMVDRERQRFELHALLREQVRQETAALAYVELHARALEAMFRGWESKLKECRECLAEIVPAIEFLNSRNPGDGNDLSDHGYAMARRVGELETALRIEQAGERFWSSQPESRESQYALQVSYGNRAVILQMWGRLEEAMALHKKEKEICEELENRDALQISYGNQALILMAWGRLEEAMALHKKEEAICEELANKNGLQRSYGNQALILQAWGRLDEAMSLHKKKEEICKELANKDGLQRSYGNQALILQAWGRLEEAMALLKKNEAICEELGNKDDLQRTYGNQAGILQAWGRLEEAIALHKKEEEICEELANKDGLQISYGNQALILKAWGRLEEAMALHKKEEEICEELANKDSLQRSYGNQALVLQAWGRLEEAMALLKKQEVICEELGNKSGLAYCYWSWGLLAREMNDPRTAEEKLMAALAIFTELKMPRERDEVQQALDAVPSQEPRKTNKRKRK